MATNNSHERNLLFAGLGLQLSLVTKEQLVRGFSEGALNKTLSLGEILVQQGAIKEEQKKTIEGAVDLQIQNDGGEVQALASVKNSQEIETSLKGIQDQELAMTLCTMNALQSRKIVGNDLAMPFGLQQPLPIKKALDQRFQRKQFLDAGNLGEIWFAKDEELNRTVVLKYIKADQQGSPFSKALFNLEGEVTGYLEHPAVVPVYGMGQDEIKRPYYAMRYIRGRKLTRAIADYHALPSTSIGKKREALTELLQSFQTACLAIEYAHSKGILHCDLKPDNIVVGPFGETLVIDWGLAMVTNPTTEMAQEINNLENIPSPTVSGDVSGPYFPSESAQPGLHSSKGGMRKFVGGTPAYMAPEQMRATRGGDVTEVNHSSDIFGLGAILYHLLASQAPYFPNKEKREDYGEFLQRIESGVFPPPWQLNPGVPKPLEAVVLKSMAAKPEDRFGSARELAEEVKRWLADEPVHAYRENAWEKSRRWARNHRTTVVAGVVLLLCLGIGGVGIALLTQGYNKQLQLSAQEAKNQEFLAKESEQKALKQESLAKENEQKAFKQESLAKANEQKALKQERLATENEQKALVQERLAKEQRELAEKREAMAITAVKQFADAVEKNPDLKNKPELEPLRKELLKEPIRFFKELSDQLRSEKNPSSKSLANLAGGLHSLANLTAEIGNQEDAISSYKEEIAILESNVKANPKNNDFQNNLALSHNNLAILYSATNRQKEAEESNQKALSLQESLVKANPKNTDFQNNLALSHHDFAILYSATNRQKEAEENSQKALALQESLVKANPTNLAFQKGLAGSHHHLALLYSATNRQKESEESYKKALALQESLVKANPGNTGFQNELAQSHHNLAILLSVTNRLKEAEDSNKKALGLRESLVKIYSTNSGFQDALSRSHNNLALLYNATNRLKQAEESNKKALALLDSLVKANPTNSGFQDALAGSHNNLALLYSAMHRLKEAEESYKKALALKESLAKANPKNSEFQAALARSHYNLGSLFLKTFRLLEAKECFQKALALQEALVKANPTNSEYQDALALSHIILVPLYTMANSQREADESKQKALALQEALVKANPTNSEFQDALARSHNIIALLYNAKNQQKEAVESYQKALAIREPLVKANPKNSLFQKDLALSHYGLALLYSAKNRQKEAEVSYQKALALQESLVKANPTNSGNQADLINTKIGFATLRNSQAWAMVSVPGKGEGEYQKGVLLALEAMKLNPFDGLILNSLGVAQYRVKQFATALESLQKSNAFNSKTNGKEGPSDLAFLAMTCHQLNKKAEAETYFKELQEAMKDKKNSENKEYQGFLKEAETLLKK